MPSGASEPEVVALFEVSRNGPGESTRAVSDAGFGVNVPKVEVDVVCRREAPHISHDDSEGWLENVHLGHLCDAVPLLLPVSPAAPLSAAFVTWEG